MQNHGFHLGAIVSDYDRTLTDDDLEPYGPALMALRRIRDGTGARAILSTGRSLSFLLGKVRVLGFFDAWVAENGAIVYLPEGAKKFKLAEKPARLAGALKSTSIPHEEGEVLLSVKREYEGKVRELVGTYGVDVNFVYNRDSIMLLPIGIDKAVGVGKALDILMAQTGDVVCIGDGENDLPLFEIANLRVATEDAANILKARAHVVCRGRQGLGVARFLEQLQLELKGGQPVSLWR